MAHHDHERNDIGQEHPVNHAGQITGALLFLVVKIMEITFLEWGVIKAGIPAVQIPVTAAILVLSVYMIRSGLKTVFEEKRDPPEVIRKGVFSRIRHPVYTGVMLILVAFTVLKPSVLSLLVLAANFLFYNWMASYEEGILLQMFGDEYRDYMKQAGRWLPKIRK